MCKSFCGQEMPDGPLEELLKVSRMDDCNLTKRISVCLVLMIKHKEEFSERVVGLIKGQESGYFQCFLRFSCAVLKGEMNVNRFVDEIFDVWGFDLGSVKILLASLIYVLVILKRECEVATFFAYMTDLNPQYIEVRGCLSESIQQYL